MKVLLHWQPRKAEFRYPIGRAPRTAILVGWFRPRGLVRVFRKGWTIDAAAYAPQCIAATFPQLEQLIANRIVSPERSVVVLANPGGPLLTSTQRDRLWRAFQVPVFEQIATRRGELFAAECEAHDGLHIESQDLAVGGLLIERSPCACGKKTPRIVPSPRAQVRAAVASATG